MDVSWLEQRDSDVPFGDWWLSERERACLDWLHIPKRRADWRLGRWTAKSAVSVYLNLPRNQQMLAGIELRPASSGAPEVFLHDRSAPVQISLSHSHGVGLCTIAPLGVELGCDLETVESRSEVFLVDYFTNEEQNLVSTALGARRDQVVTLLWSTKESVLKALRCGLRSDTRAVNAAPADFPENHGDEWHLVSAAHTSGRNFCGWWRVSRDLVRTIVADPTPLRLVALSQGASKKHNEPPMRADQRRSEGPVS
jgi:4'-phosphopantetheinyl transferase